MRSAATRNGSLRAVAGLASLAAGAAGRLERGSSFVRLLTIRVAFCDYARDAT
jgi:hypothetical protein